MTRIPPLPKNAWSPEMTAFVESFRSSVKGAGPEEERASAANFLGTLARYPDLAKALLTFNRHLLSATSLTVRQRELLILRVAFIRNFDYEWAQHVLLALKSGVTSEEIARVAAAPGAPEWILSERALLRSAGELLDDGVVSDDTWAVLAELFGEQQLMDIVFTVGTYAMLGMAMRTFDVEPEEELLPHLPVRPASGSR